MTGHGTRAERRRLIVRALEPDPPGDDDPDADFIRLCDHLKAIKDAEDYAHEAVADEKQRDGMLAPVHDLWHHRWGGR